MVMHYLKPQIDIHGGGNDLIFPHHDCEIVQSEHATGLHPFVQTWMHTGMVYQDGEKMSKSLGNLTLVSNLVEEYTPDAIRIVLQSHHYRYPWECFPADLKIAAETASIFKKVRELIGDPSTYGTNSTLHNRFITLMDADLNTPEAIQLLRQNAKDALAHQDLDLGAEVLRLTAVLGLRA